MCLSDRWDAGIYPRLCASKLGAPGGTRLDLPYLPCECGVCPVEADTRELELHGKNTRQQVSNPLSAV